MSPPISIHHPILQVIFTVPRLRLGTCTQSIFRNVEADAPLDAQKRLLALLDEPWLLEELQTDGLVREIGPGHVIPTLAGVRALEFPEGPAIEAACSQLHGALSELYRERPGAPWPVQGVAERAELPIQMASHCLAYLVADRPDYFNETAWDAGGRLEMVRPTSAVLAEQGSVPRANGQEEGNQAGPGRLIARDFRCLARVDWSPSGVCLLAGPNGSGKTTVLDALGFLVAAYRNSVPDAVTESRGSAGLRRLDADTKDPVLLTIERNGLAWTLELPTESGGVGEFPGETVTLDGKVIVKRLRHSPHWYLHNGRRTAATDGKPCLRVAADMDPDTFAPLTQVLQGFRRYGGYNIELLRDGGRGGEHETQLSRFGENALVVLRNWRAAPNRFQNRFDWVVEKMRELFPGLIDDIDFDPPVGNVVPARFLIPGGGVLPIHRASDGMLVGLLHLMAAAGAGDGAFIAVDELENQLHPHAIRQLIRAIREVASERNVTVVLTTHSPVALNEFNDTPEDVFLMEPGHEVLPVALDEVQDPEWLRQFQLGDLYESNRFAAPAGVRD